MTTPETTLQPVSMVVLWTTPEDPAGFDADYRSNHLPLAREVPGLLEVRAWTLRSSGHHRMAELAFATRDDLRAGMRSPAGEALAADTRRLEEAFGVKAEVHIATPDPVPSGAPG